MALRTPRVAVVGSANVDLTCFTAAFPRPGETIFGRSSIVGYGGKGANQAVAARRCGAEAALVARLGDDLFGPASLRHYEDLGIDCSGIRLVPGVASGTAAILVDDRGENRIIVVRGANEALVPEEIEASAALLQSADCILVQLEIPIETVYHLLERARAWGVRTILNPAPAVTLELDRARLAGFIVPNETEAETLTGIAARDEAGARRAADDLRRQGFGTAIITLGAEGALLSGPEGTERLPSFPVDMVDSTGAGDAFIGSFATFLCEGLPAREAARRACLYAALSVTSPGAQTSYRDRAAFESAWRSRGPEAP